MARPREFDEEQVLTAARDAFWSKGFAGTSVSDLTEATGLGKGSLYGAFGDKEQLFTRVFGDYCTRACAVADDQLAGPDDTAFARLGAYLRDMARQSAVALDEAGNPRTLHSRDGCFLAKTTAELAGRDEAIAGRALETFRGLRERLTGIVAAAQRAGDFDASIDAEAYAGMLLATLRGFESLGKAGMTAAELGAMGDVAASMLPGAH
ncbi:MAG: TetR/AcrR family transcriptional regulator [Solirubrobacteraceae bacterium]|nr:TetR/AcrR family transcriptional regulator [Patulibacter sp.]